MRKLHSPLKQPTPTHSILSYLRPYLRPDRTPALKSLVNIYSSPLFDSVWKPNAAEKDWYDISKYIGMFVHSTAPVPN